MKSNFGELKTAFKIALVGNPNCGKTSLFNLLTGLRQKVANYPGVTVDKKTGEFDLDPNQHVEIVDLPGTYSLYPRSLDEFVAFDVLLNRDNESHPDLVVVVADASNLKRNLLFASQIIDLRIPTVIALNMLDVAEQQNIHINLTALSDALDVPVVAINARKGTGIEELKKVMLKTKEAAKDDFIDLSQLHPALVQEIHSITKCSSDYAALLTAHHYMNIFCLDAKTKERVRAKIQEHAFKHSVIQGDETLLRYERINQLLSQVSDSKPSQEPHDLGKIDKVLTHPIWGYISFVAIMFVMFQIIFSVASYPMDAIDNVTVQLRLWLSQQLPNNIWTDLLNNGLIAGLSGVFIFIPQIMLLFGMITILEDTGYMARVSFMMDKLMRKVGMNGRSVVPLMSGMACAVPAIMSARTIENRKDRLITLFVTPLMSCSARLPVYTLLVGMLVPNEYLFGVISLPGLVMLGLYFLGFFAAIVVAFVMNLMVKQKQKSYFIMELPVYRMPRIGNIFITMYEKAKIFTFEAGKVILSISLVLWVLATFGPSNSREKVEKNYQIALVKANTDSLRTLAENEYQAAKLESSYAGTLGKVIEPVIKPLGFDWKLGIALVTSFAAREVFVGTMSTLYSVGSDADERSLKAKLNEARDEDGKPIFTMAMILSLLIFYAFALQCMSTIAVVKRESGSWMLAIAQVFTMTGLAYLCSGIVFQLLK